MITTPFRYLITISIGMKFQDHRFNDNWIQNIFKAWLFSLKTILFCKLLKIWFQKTKSGFFNSLLLNLGHCQAFHIHKPRCESHHGHNVRFLWLYFLLILLAFDKQWYLVSKKAYQIRICFKISFLLHEKCLHLFQDLNPGPKSKRNQT